MRIAPAIAGSSRLIIVIPVMLAAAVAGCSNSSRFSDGPTWSLTGGKNAVPPPPAQPPAQMQPQLQLQLQPQPQPSYRGGRDPVSGRAAAYGQGNQVAAVPLPPPGAEQVAPSPRPYPAPVAGYEARPAVPQGRLGTNTYGRRIVTVQPGDSLASIAQANRVSIASLMFSNGLKDVYLSPGQQLVLPPR